MFHVEVNLLLGPGSGPQSTILQLSGTTTYIYLGAAITCWSCRPDFTEKESRLGEPGAAIECINESIQTTS
jgi:hypothetical protein